MARRSLIAFALLVFAALPASANKTEKGQFHLFLNGVKKGYEKYKIEVQPKEGLWSISSEVRFSLPVPKAKRGYVDLKLYPVLDFTLDSREFSGYYYRMAVDDFSRSEMTEAEKSATEYIDQDLMGYDLAARSQKLQDDEMKDRIDLGVNAGKLIVRGQTLLFKQTKFSDSRLKEEPLPADLALLDAYTFIPYIALTPRALAMKTDSENLTIAFPQGMRLRPGKLVYMGVESTPFRGKTPFLRHYDVTVGEGLFASFWIDKSGKLVQVSIPTEGLIAAVADYEPKAFDREEPRIVKQAVAATGSFSERTLRIPSGAISLGATLTLPAGEGAFPTLLLLQDFQPVDRDGNEPDNPYNRAGTWKQLAYQLASDGFATLRYDARGVGESTGSSERFSWSERVQDVVALCNWLRQQPSTKNQKVILASLGLGGWVAADAAERAQAAGLLAVAYPAKGLLRLWREQANALSDPEARLRAQADLDALSAKLSENGADSMLHGGHKVFLPEIREMAAKDPLALAGALKIPCLFVYPERDQSVMPFHRDVLAPALHAGQEALSVPGVGHWLTAIDSDDRQSGLVESKNLQAILAWLKKVS